MSDDHPVLSNKFKLQNGRFVIVSLLGQGGFANVYKVKDKEYGKIYAMKELVRTADTRSRNPHLTETFEEEATTISHLSHPHIPQLIKFFKERGHDFFVMELIDGGDLQDVMSAREDAGKGRYIPVLEAVRIGRQISGVLAFLHDRDEPVIFRDVKPSNIMLSNEGKAYLVDFGITRKYKEGKECDTSDLGTRIYAAPEQFNRGLGQTDGRTDVFSLGATLYTVLTGNLFGPFAVPELTLPNNQPLPERLKALIKHMTMQKREDRPKDAYFVQRELVKIERELLGIEE